jgi:hypothetical protein
VVRQIHSQLADWGYCSPDADHPCGALSVASPPRPRERRTETLGVRLRARGVSVRAGADSSSGDSARTDSAQAISSAPEPVSRHQLTNTDRPTATPTTQARAARDDWGPGIHEDGFGLLAEDDVNATTLTGRPVLATTVRKWMDHGQVGSLCLWRRGQVWGQRLVYWPDVAERATVGGNRRAS